MQLLGILIPPFLAAGQLLEFKRGDTLITEGAEERSDGARNLLFFGDMATFEIAALRRRFLERYLPPNDQSFAEKYLDDLCVQIAVNSRIATRKFRLFTASASCVLLAMAILSVPPVWQVIRIARDAKLMLR